MRELTVAEIEVVSGAGWFDWFGGVQEQVSQFMSQIMNFFSGSNIPDGPTAGQRRAIDDYCKSGLHSMSLSETGGSASLSISTINGVQIKITEGSGKFEFQCFKPGGLQP